MTEVFGDDGPGTVGRNHPDTSHEAARRVGSKKQRQYRQIVDLLFRHESGETDLEQQRKLDMPQNTQRPRRRELELMGIIRRAGKRKVEGYSRIVFILVPEDERAAQADLMAVTQTKKGMGQAIDLLQTHLDIAVTALESVLRRLQGLNALTQTQHEIERAIAECTDG